jgi:acetoacetyl-CoA reductase
VNLCGRTALVTGSSRGIGRAIATELAKCGANVVINYLEHQDQAFELCQELQALGHGIEVLQGDASDREQAANLVDTVIERFGQIDVLANNAGITRDRTLSKISFEEWDRVIEVNLTGTFNYTKLVVPHMINSGGGSIINIASVVAQTGAFGQTNYAAAKAGIVGLTKSCALELARYGIRVNAVCPGFVDTDMVRAIPPEIREGIRQRIPLGRFGKPEEIARCVRFLATEAEYLTGQCINVNGGLFM